VRVRIGTSRVAHAREHTLSDGRRRFTLQLDNDAPVDVTWTYDVSNVAAINAEELSLLPDRREWFENVEPTEDLRAHINRLECDELELVVLFGVGIPAPLAARALVERLVPERDESPWQVDEVETTRVDAELMKDRREGPSIGVVGFADAKAARDRKLAALTEQIASRQSANSGSGCSPRRLETACCIPRALAPERLEALLGLLEPARNILLEGEAVAFSREVVLPS